MNLEKASLSHSKWMEIHEATLDFHSQTTLEALRLCIVQWARRLIAADTASLCDTRGGFERMPWTDLSSDAMQVKRVLSPLQATVGAMLVADFGRDIFTDRDSFIDLWSSAPNVPNSAVVPHTEVQQFSQYHTAREFRKTQLYSECYAPVDQEMWIGAELGDKMLCLAVSRKRREFSDEELFTLELLRPQIKLVYHRLLLLSRRSTERSEASIVGKLVCHGMTLREAEILYWLTEGKTNPAIGIILKIACSTVKTHLLSIYRKLGCETRTAATRWAMEKITNEISI